MDEEQIRKIAEDAFKAHVSEPKIIHIDVEPWINHAEERVVDVNIYYDGKYNELRSALLHVHSDIVAKAWREVEEDLGFPLIHFYSKSTYNQHNKTARRSLSNSQSTRSTGPSDSR